MAQQLFYTKGYERTSVSDVVKGVGVAKGTFYYYFDSKLDILQAMIDELVQQSLTVMHAIIADDSLTTLEKWHKAFNTTAVWKTDHKEELIAVVKMMRSPGNVVLYYNFQKETMRLVVPEIAQIIQQGVDEGIFDTPDAETAAEIAFAVMQSASDLLSDLILNPDRYDNRAAIAKKKLAAIETAVTRILGAAPGSLQLVDEAILDTWFD